MIFFSLGTKYWKMQAQ